MLIQVINKWCSVGIYKTPALLVFLEEEDSEQAKEEVKIETKKKLLRRPPVSDNLTHLDGMSLQISWGRGWDGVGGWCCGGVGWEELLTLVAVIGDWAWVVVWLGFQGLRCRPISRRNHLQSFSYWRKLHIAGTSAFSFPSEPNHSLQAWRPFVMWSCKL